MTAHARPLIIVTMQASKVWCCAGRRGSLLVAGLLLAAVVAFPGVAGAETVQTCRRRGCKLNVNTYRCVCPRRIPKRPYLGGRKLRCPRRTRLLRHRAALFHRHAQPGLIYRCAYRKHGSDVQHGPFVKLRPDRSLLFWSHYRHGKRHGERLTFWRDGRTASQEFFRNGKKHGTSTLWYANRQKRSVETWKDGRRNGLAKTWHPNGRLKSMGKYVANGKEGVFKRWHKNGKLYHLATYKANKAVGVAKGWDASGKQVLHTPYVNGRRHGSAWSVHRGEKRVTQYRHGRRHGSARSYFKNGKLRDSMQYYRGYANGRYRRWNKKGVLIEQFNFVKGKRQGPYQAWYDNGRLRTRGKYRAGAKVGVWVHLGVRGNLLSRDDHGNP